MNWIAKIRRLFYINFVIARYRLDDLLFATPFFYPLRFLSYLNPWAWMGNGKLTRGERLRLAFEELGPIFVKFGQILSTRKDLLPDDITDELAKLQDRVPPFSGEQAKKIVEDIYDRPLHDLFYEFDLIPLASASIAQVHPATLLSGEKVVVKILRPGIEKVIKQDVAVLRMLAGLIERFWSQGKRTHPREIVSEFEQTIYHELDLLREAASASQLRRNFANSQMLYIPKIYWSYVHQNVMVMERIGGIPIANVQALIEAHTNLKKLAENGVEIFFTQVFRDSFFHADMHPGNLFISVEDPQNPVYIAVDFGIMGSLSPVDQRYLAENLIAFFQRDYRQVAVLHVQSGWVSKDTRIDEFEAAIRSVCEPIFERPLKEISVGQLLVRLFQTAGRFNMEIQPQLILLQKTLLNIEGLGRLLYPELDLWATAKPFLERWIKQKTSPKTLLSKVYQRAPFWAEKLVNLPDLMYDTIL